MLLSVPLPLTARLGELIRFCIPRRLRDSAFEAVSARIAFDGAVSIGALAVAAAFKTLFIPGPFQSSLVAALPLVFVAAAAASGVYTRLRGVRSRRKAVRLAVVALASSVAALAVGAEASIVALWALLTVPSVVLPRVLLAMNYRKRAFVSRIARAQHGPVLLIG